MKQKIPDFLKSARKTFFGAGVWQVQPGETLNLAFLALQRGVKSAATSEQAESLQKWILR